VAVSVLRDALEPPAAPAGELWTSLTLLAFYRVLVAAFFVVLSAIGSATFSLGEYAPRLFQRTSVTYLLVAIAFLLVASQFRRLLHVQLTLHILADVLLTTVLMYASGGFRSGLGVMLLISLAGAALVADRMMTLFYAAVATLAVLGEQTSWVLRSEASPNAYLQPGLLSVGYFATAVLVNRLAGRVMQNEQVARERGVQLADQLRVNELVIQDVQDGVLVVDAAGIVRQSNRQAAALIGAARIDHLPVDVIAPDLAKQLHGWRNRDAGARDVVRLPDPERRVRVRFQDAGVSGRSFTLVFLEDLSRLEQEAQKVKLVALGRLTASIAHEIRNPLSAITHATDLLAEENRAAGRERLARIIRDNAYRLDRMVQDVLELNRRDLAQVEPLGLAAFVTTFLDDFAQYEKVARETFDVRIDAGLVAAFDRVHLNQVLWNLVRNACRHSTREPGSVILRAETLGGRIELHVCDDGPGVPEAVRGQLFEPFFTTFSKGTGLGLYIARELCAANGTTLAYVPGTPGADFVIRWAA
jgi:two-component system sensor histidine kinase PilS (NtrC family)